MEVDKETDEYYHGIISERAGSYNAKLLKNITLKYRKVWVSWKNGLVQ